MIHNLDVLILKSVTLAYRYLRPGHKHTPAVLSRLQRTDGLIEIMQRILHLEIKLS